MCPPWPLCHSVYSRECLSGSTPSVCSACWPMSASSLKSLGFPRLEVCPVCCGLCQVDAGRSHRQHPCSAVTWTRPRTSLEWLKSDTYKTTTLKLSTASAPATFTVIPSLAISSTSLKFAAMWVRSSDRFSPPRHDDTTNCPDSADSVYRMTSAGLVAALMQLGNCRQFVLKKKNGATCCVQVLVHVRSALL